MFKGKIYDKLLEQKKESDGHTDLLAEGARRIGNSTVVEEFGNIRVNQAKIITSKPRLRPCKLFI